MTPGTTKFDLIFYLLLDTDSNFIHTDQSAIDFDGTNCVVVYVGSDSDEKRDKQTQTSDDEIAETSANNGVKTKDASTQTTNSYFFLQVYDVEGEMKLAFNTTSAFSEQ